MPRKLSIIFSILLIITFVSPPLIMLFEDGKTISYVDFGGDENEKEEPNESDKEKNEVFFSTLVNFNFRTIALKINDNDDKKLAYQNRSPDIFLPPPKKIRYVII